MARASRRKSSSKASSASGRSPSVSVESGPLVSLIPGGFVLPQRGPRRGTIRGEITRHDCTQFPSELSDHPARHSRRAAAGLVAGGGGVGRARRARPLALHSRGRADGAGGAAAAGRGLVIYLLLRPRETLVQAYDRALEQEALLQQIETKPICPTCARPTEPAWFLCPTCHTHLRQPCPVCRSPLELHWDICPYCGYLFETVAEEYGDTPRSTELHGAGEERGGGEERGETQRSAELRGEEEI